MDGWVLGLVVLVAAGTALCAVWRLRCSHPHPYHVPAATRLDPETGQVIVEPEHYLCFECGRAWLVSIDPAWKPTGVVQKFSGFDPERLSRSATRAAIERDQRQFLAAKRAQPIEPPPPASSVPATRRPVRPKRSRRKGSAVLLFRQRSHARAERLG